MNPSNPMRLPIALEYADFLRNSNNYKEAQKVLKEAISNAPQKSDDQTISNCLSELKKLAQLCYEQKQKNLVDSSIREVSMQDVVPDSSRKIQ